VEIYCDNIFKSSKKKVEVTGFRATTKRREEAPRLAARTEE